MKILLVNPPRFYELVGKNPAIVEDNRGYNPPLGVLSLAGFLESQTDHEIEVLDAQPYEYNYEELKTIFAEKMGDVVGITAMTFTLIDVIKTCRLIKSLSPETKIVLGGPHVHLYPMETIAIPEVDFLVLGEGEYTFIKLLENLHNPAVLEGIQGLVFEKDGRVVNNGISPIIKDLDALGYPARHKVDVTRYASLLGRNNVITTMFTSRGCPYSCTFCDRPNSPTISGFRWRSAKSVVDEMQACLDLGIDEAFIYDDTFTVRKDRVMELCEEIKRRKINFRWDVRAHVNTMNQEMLRAMKDAGCDRIHYGVEVGNNRMMKVIRKNATIEKVKQVVQWTKDVEMETLAYFMMGQQTEKAGDVQDTINLAQELKPNYAHFTIFCPYPGTNIYAQGLANGIIKKDVWREFAKNPTEDFELPFWEENFTRHELREMLVQAYRTFYLRPGYILKRMTQVKSVGEFKRKMKAGLSVLTMRADQHLAIKSKAKDLVPLSSYDANC